MSEENSKGKNFKFRTMTSFMMAAAFVILVITGLVLYIVPPGRVAKWTNWQLLWMDKEQWIAVHTLFSFLFLFFGIFHVYYNWKVLVNSLIDKIKGGLKKKKEFYASVSMTLLFLIGTIAAVPPFQTVMDLGEYFKEAWPDNKIEAPIPHAERLSVKELSAKLKIPYDQALQNLKQAGVIPHDKETLEQIGARVGQSPSQLYNTIQGKKSSGNLINKFQGTGLGRKPLSQVCRTLKLDCSQVKQRLEKNGIKVNGDPSIRDMAKENNRSNSDIVKILQN